MTAQNAPTIAIEILAQHARGEIHHLNAGLCPDGIEGSSVRDAECPVCQALEALAGPHSGDSRITASLSLGKAKALGLLGLQPGVHAVCEGDLVERFAALMDENCVGPRRASSLWVRLDATGQPMLGTVRQDQPTYEHWNAHDWVKMSTQPEFIPHAIRQIAKRLIGQDNRVTDHPIFAVMEKQVVLTLDTHEHDRIEWIDTKSGDYTQATPQKARHLEAKHRAGVETPGWERYAVKEVDSFVTACFSEEGCENYLSRDRHNLRKPFIYAFGSHRNDEWRDILDFFASINLERA